MENMTEDIIILDAGPEDSVLAICCLGALGLLKS